MRIDTPAQNSPEEMNLRYRLQASDFVETIDDFPSGRPTLYSLLHHGEVLLLGASLLLMTIMLIG